MKHAKRLLLILAMLMITTGSVLAKDYDLHRAVMDNDIKLVDKLIGKGHFIDEIGSRKYGYGSALHLAVREGRLDIAKLLLKRGAQVDVLDPDDLTPLHNAAWNGNLEMMQLLLEAGADINASTYDGDTPLSLAQKNDQAQVAEFLQAKLQSLTISEIKVDASTSSDPGVIDVSGTYAIAELTYPTNVTRYKDWYLGEGKNLEITLQQNGSSVTGVFSGDLRGTIEGVINGNEITFEFDGTSQRGSSNYGKGLLLLSDDSAELTGTFKLNTSHYGPVVGNWNFRKIEGPVTDVESITGTYHAQLSGSGVRTVQKDQSTPIEFTMVQNGNEIIGTVEGGTKYKSSKKFYGDIDGDRIKYSWDYWGCGLRGHLTISPGGDRMTGTWGKSGCTVTHGGTWTLTRIK